MPETLFEKIWSDHLIADAGGGDLILIDRILLHERTGGVALQSLASAGRGVAGSDSVFATMDHVVDTFPGRTDRTLMPTGTLFIEATRRETRAAGIRLFDIGDEAQGIVHVMSPEQGIVLPGLTLVCPDSHTGTQGALGALAWGIGSTEAEHALATRTLRVSRPRTLRARIEGDLRGGATAKDLALHIIGLHGARGAQGCVVEFMGSTIERMEVEGRMTLCNMATELSAFTAIIAPDDKTFGYLRGRRFAPRGAAWDQAMAYWRGLRSDAGAAFDVNLEIDAGCVRPMVTWGTNPQQVVPVDDPVPGYREAARYDTLEAYERALAYMNLRPGQPLLGLPIDGAFIGACTNSRLGDLRSAAAVLEHRSVAPGVRAICVPGSTAVKHAAEAEGLDETFKRAGFEWRESGCSMCFYAGGESFGAQQRIISSTNRNFENRQGPGTRTHLASPATVAASAVAGHIADVRRLTA